jgi:hypothetical protein
MAVGFPTKTTYADGDVYSASDVNDTNGTLNLVNPTAKGGLVSASAANTPAVLSVGTDYAFLQADSTQSTGLNWENAAWISYTPTVTSPSGTFTTTSATGYYKRLGKICQVKAAVVITSVGSGTAVRFSLPFTSKTGQDRSTGAVREVAVTGLVGVSVIDAGSTTATLFRYDNNSYVGNNHSFVTSLTYEVN